ncbi:MAG: metallopeptidase family protein [Allosphingosinicella sp.]
MKKADAELIVEMVMQELPDPVCEALADVTVYTVDGRTDPEVRAAIRNAGLARAQILADFRGLYLGTTCAPGGPGVAGPLPKGSIVLNAETLDGIEDVRDTLAHEIGHALGMSEAEVEDLGLG